MNFKVGQKICCVKEFTSMQKGEIVPQKNIVYTVREVSREGSVRLVEIINEPRQYNEGFAECLFCSSNFAPIITNTSTADIANQIFETCNDVKEIKIPELV